MSILNKGQTSSDDSAEQRHGNNRGDILARYGYECQNCGYVPDYDTRFKLHVHHKKQISEGGGNSLDNLAVLCRDCHINHHSNSYYDKPLVSKVCRVFSNNLSHKNEFFESRINRRVSLSSSYKKEKDKYVVEGLLPGDKYDHYYINIDNIDENHFGMCSCYDHKFGSAREINICSHSGAAICEAIVKADGTEPQKLKTAKSYASKLNRSASIYTRKKETVYDSIDRLKRSSGYKDYLLEKGKRQAVKMVRYGKREWTCFGGPCNGAKVTVGSDGYVCHHEGDDHGGGYPPCAGEMGAYILRKLELGLGCYACGRLFDSEPEMVDHYKDKHGRSIID